MKRGWVSKAIVVAGLAFVLTLAGCDFFAGIFDPLIGKWSYSTTLFGVTITATYTFHGDETWEFLGTQTGSADTAMSGTYTHDAKAGTLEMTTTSGGTGTMSFAYEISTDNKTLTLTQGADSLALTRQ